jgi:putative nucleotidyltransferase with HDIG domain
LAKKFENIKRIYNNVFPKYEKFEFKNNAYIKIAISVITLAVLIIFLPSYKDIDISSEIGTIWSSEDLIAPFTFPIYKNEQDYAAEKKEVEKNSDLVFVESVEFENLNDTLGKYFNILDKLFFESVNLEKKNAGGIQTPALNQYKEELKLDLTPAEWDRFFKFYKGELKEIPLSYPEFKNIIIRSLSKQSSLKIINQSKSKITSKNITIKKQEQKLQEIIDTYKILDRSEAVNKIRETLTPLIRDNELLGISISISNNFIKENLIFDKNLTDLEIQNRIDQIPKTIGIVKENERIISKHDPIDKNTKIKLDSYKKIRFEKEGVQDYFIQYLGKALIVSILFIMLSMFLYFIRPAIFKDNSKLALISSLILLINLLAFISMNIQIKYPVELMILVPVASILLTILFDSRLAFYSTVVICLLIASVRGGDFTITLISFVGSAFAIFSVRDLQNRNLIFRSFFYILVGYTISILAIGLDRSQGISNTLTRIIFGSINSVLSPIIAYGLLFFYERTFNITTNLTLLELADFNHPLLKKLSTQAPGTFHHSIVMGNLSEAAAESIGANRILARVGCYYHDIGKMNKPEFFVENQLERINRHETLNPNISAKVIISHVKEGIELAKTYSLPQEIINFIPEHHGTTLVSYFYSKAIDMVDMDKEDVSKFSYQYSGPKPQSKETGIVMLADTIEAAARSLDEPTPKKLEDKIDEIIKMRLDERQLDECNLTLKELNIIKMSFLKILVGIHHQRIRYPEDKNK